MKKPAKTTGTLIIIGGHEDKEGDCVILKEVLHHLPDKRLVLTTVASQEPDSYFDDYKQAFARLGLEELTHLYVADRAESADPEKLAALHAVQGVFFSGGDQLRISSQIGDTPFETRIMEIYKNGGVIAGTSAGASVMGETMLIRGPNSESHRIGDLHMAPGLKLIRDVIIDQHFAERGRIGRLLGAVALNPRLLGIGIDENTAIIVRKRAFHVLGAGAVYVIDGAGVTHSNIAEGEEKRALSIYDVKLHVLSNGDCFNLRTRRPMTFCEFEGRPSITQPGKRISKDIPLITRKPKEKLVATNQPANDGHRNGAVRKRSQLSNPITDTMTKRDRSSGEFMDVKSDSKKFKGVRKEK